MGSSRDLDTSDSAAEKGTPAVAPVVAPAAPGAGQDAVIEATELEVEGAIEKKEEHTKASFAHFIVCLMSSACLSSLTESLEDILLWKVVGLCLPRCWSCGSNGGRNRKLVFSRKDKWLMIRPCH